MVAAQRLGDDVVRRHAVQLDEDLRGLRSSGGNGGDERITVGLGDADGRWIGAGLAEGALHDAVDIVVDNGTDGARGAREEGLGAKGTGAAGDESDFASDGGGVVLL